MGENCPKWLVKSSKCSWKSLPNCPHNVPECPKGPIRTPRCPNRLVCPSVGLQLSMIPINLIEFHYESVNCGLDLFSRPRNAFARMNPVSQHIVQNIHGFGEICFKLKGRFSRTLIFWQINDFNFTNTSLWRRMNYLSFSMPQPQNVFEC